MKTITTLSLAILFCLLTKGGLYCQSNAPQHLDSLNRLIGKWEGEGWQQMPNGEKSTFKQTEEIRYQLDKRLMIIHGTGQDTKTNQKVFEAYGILSHDATQNKLVMNAYTLDGRHTIADFEITEEGFDWWFSAGNGTIKYKATVSATTWIEEGFYSPDGEKWYPFFRMDLKKIATD